MSRNNQTHIQHTKSWSTCWAGWGTRHPNIWTMLILSTCKPLPHTFQTPHGSTITGNTFTLTGCSTHFLKLDVCRLLHAANTGLWLLNTVQRKDRLKLENQMPKRVKTNWTARNFNQTRMYYKPLSGNGKAEWRELWLYLERLSRTSRMEKPGILALEWLWFKHKSLHELHQMYKLL